MNSPTDPTPVPERPDLAAKPTALLWAGRNRKGWYVYSRDDLTEQQALDIVRWNDRVAAAPVPDAGLREALREIEALRTSSNRQGSPVSAFMDGVEQSAAILRAALSRQAEKETA